MRHKICRRPSKTASVTCEIELTNFVNMIYNDNKQNQNPIYSEWVEKCYSAEQENWNLFSFLPFLYLTM